MIAWLDTLAPANSKEADMSINGAVSGQHHVLAAHNLSFIIEFKLLRKS